MAKIINPKKGKKDIQDVDGLRDKRHTQFRDRLIRVRTSNRLWTVLERQNFFVCGYCGQRMALYSPLSLTGREEDPNLFYGCSRRCELSGIHRHQFIDGKLIDFIYKRFREMFPDVKGKKKNVKALTEEFEEIARLDKKRRHKLELLPHAGFNRDDLLKELIELEEIIKERRDKAAGLSDKRPEKSTLFAPIFIAESAEELFNLDLLYLRELVRAAVRRIRFFNETLILRVTPLDDEEHRLDTEGNGKLFNIHLQFDPRSLDIKEIIENPDPDEVQEPAKDEERPKYAFERTDLEYIMAEEEDESDYAGYDRADSKVDIELLMTEPGSKKEKEILKKREEEE